MPVRKSLNAYLKERLNCAQSIMRGFQEYCDVSEEKIEEVKNLGGGKAEGGTCGALHSALVLSKNDKSRNDLRLAFIAQAGSDKCKEIRSGQRLTCGECVGLAARLLHEQQK